MKNKFYTICITIVCLISIQFWAFKIVSIPINFSFFLFSLFSVIFLLTRKTKNAIPLALSVKYILFTMLLGIIPASIEHGQSLSQSIVALSGCAFPFLFYFILHSWSVSSEKVIKICLFIAIVFTVIEWLQQLTYPIYYFGEGDYNRLLRQRMGLWRFRLWGIDFVTLVLFYYVEKFLLNVKSKQKLSIFLITMLLLLGVIGDQARKEIYGVFVCFIFAIFLQKKKKLSVSIILFVGILFFSFLFISNKMSDLNAQTKSELNDENYVRKKSMEYVIYEMSDSPLFVLFGTGPSLSTSSLGQKLSELREKNDFFISDIGIIGYYSQFGLIGVSAFIFLFYIIVKNWKYIDLYLKLYSLLNLFLLITTFPPNSSYRVFAFILYLYLLDLSITKNKVNYNKTHYKHEDIFLS